MIRMVGTRNTVSRDNRLAIGALFLIVFIVLTWLVTSGLAQALDSGLSLYINKMHVGLWLNLLFILATKYGREYFWIPVTAVMLLFGKRETKVLAIELAALFLIGIIAGEAMKFAMYRARPYETLAGVILRVAPQTDSSYPSGHALIVFIGSIFVLTKLRKSIRGRAIAVLLTLEAAIVAYSRIYVGMHYLSDVFGGVFLAGAIVFIGMFIIERYFKWLVDSLLRLTEKLLKHLHFPEVF